jgi:FAD/FMN-containing dehydrogenase
MEDRLAAALRPLLAGTGVRMVTDPADMAPALNDWRGRFSGEAVAVLLPDSTAAVAAAVRACRQLGLGIVPQGGNTGLCGGATPAGAMPQVVLGLARMNRIRSVDAAGSTLVAEAGCILQDVQQAAANAGRQFPLSLAAEGSAQIGGLLATNAGGTAVLKYGNARSLVLGLEVVLADGSVWDGLRELRKDNTGYDLRQLFVGSEGTLGVITAASLALHPPLPLRVTALAALDGVRQAIELLATLQGEVGERLCGYEVFDQRCLRMTLSHHPGLRAPLEAPHPWYALIELGDASPLVPLARMAEDVLGGALERGLVADVALATSEGQRAAFWALRESISEAQKREGFTLKHDVSVPVGGIPRFVESTARLLARDCPGCEVAAFGHFGDGNVHYNVRPPRDAADRDEDMEQRVAAAVYGSVAALRGSFSAEHGIGQLKTAQLRQHKSPAEYRLLLALKNALDPEGLLNPGKVLADPAQPLG